MNYKSIIFSLFILLGLLINVSLVAQPTMDYLLADNFPEYSSESNPADKSMPYSLDFIEIAKQENAMFFEGELSETYVVVRKGKRRGKGKGEYSFRINLEYDLPDKIISGSTFLFKCRISKGDLIGSAKLKQRLPIGFDIVESVIGNAKTSYSNYTLSLLWDEVPADSIFEISYNVVVNRSYGYLPISTILYFEETGKKYLFNTHVLVDKEQPAEDLIVYNPPDKDAGIILVETVKPGKGSNIMPLKIYTAKTENEIPDQQPIIVSGGLESKKQSNETITTNEVVSVNSGTKTELYNKESTNVHEVASESTGIKTGSNVNKSNEAVYSIQILALMYNNVKPENLNRKYNISENIKVEQFHNWRKYTVGSFASLSEAKATLASLHQKGFKDAFIVGYKNGYRYLVY